MWRKACPLMIGVLVAALVRMRRRLVEAEAELQRMQANVGSVASASIGASGSEARAAVFGSAGDPDATALQGLASEWEAAVPPMDS